MGTKLRRATCLSAFALSAAYLLFGPRPAREPAGGDGCEVEAVMITDSSGWQAYPRPPCRVLRGGRVVVDRRSAGEPTGPVIRLDLTIGEEHVVIFTRAVGHPTRAGGDAPPPSAPSVGRPGGDGRGVNESSR